MMKTDGTPLIPRLYFGEVMHARLNPFKHRFTYRFFTGFFDIDRVDELGSSRRLFSHNKWNLFSFFDKDHGPQDGSALRPWVEGLLKEANTDFVCGQIMLLCLPRILGYVFNPLSVFYCFDKKGELRAILYEVHNTFGESHTYVMPVTFDKGTKVTAPHDAEKSFYVSPFIGMEAKYHFKLNKPSDTVAVNIRQTDNQGDLLLATLTGRGTDFSDRKLLRFFFAYPLLTVSVVGAIHWQALRLFLKGARYHGHAAAKPKQKISYEVVRSPLS